MKTHRDATRRAEPSLGPVQLLRVAGGDVALFGVYEYAGSPELHVESALWRYRR